ncbi:hypothetical protein [Pseudoxanthomonas sacheonensis]|uniref:hypothetical protein n=1 Tax=Pseudoxanthomonas sacheonensis TaxID=443615 RepID=UPI0013D3D964|nr:hypothetical protein [Pseudoxanthomonas sacheonensis]
MTGTIRPPSPHPARKVRALTELLIACFDQGPDFSSVVGQSVAGSARAVRKLRKPGD